MSRPDSGILFPYSLYLQLYRFQYPQHQARFKSINQHAITEPVVTDNGSDEFALGGNINGIEIEIRITCHFSSFIPGSPVEANDDGHFISYILEVVDQRPIKPYRESVFTFFDFFRP